jgi:hypothetical protein
MITLCTYCSAAKSRSPGSIPAIDRYRSARIRSIHAAARESGLGFLILSGRFGLVAPDEPIPHYDHLLVAEEVAAHSIKVSGQMTALGVEELVFHTVPPATDPNVQPYLDCIEEAARRAGVELQFIHRSDLARGEPGGR